MNQIEQNIVNSFKLAKSDIIQLQHNVIELTSINEKLIDRLARLEAQVYVLKNKSAAKPTTKTQTKTKTVTVHKAAKKVYVASKTGKKFHLSNCPYAQNIKPKMKLTFKTKTKPLNEGYKPCNCIK